MTVQDGDLPAPPRAAKATMCENLSHDTITTVPVHKQVAETHHV